MSDTNPYEAPRADIGPGFAASASDLAAALADFTRSRAPLLAVAVLLCVMAVVGVGSALYALATIAGDFGAGMSVTFLFLGVSAGGNILAAVSVFWLRQVLAALGPSATLDQVALAMRRLGNFWMLAAVLWCLPTLSNLAMTFGFWMFPMLGAVVGAGPSERPLVDGAVRWRNMVRVCLIAGAVLILLKVATQVVSPFAATGLVAFESRVWLFGGVLAQLGLGAMAWRQVPALEAFIALPSPTTLAAVATAHRAFWRVAAWGALGVLGFNMLSGIVMQLLL